MKNFRKIIAVLLAVIMVVGLVGCSAMPKSSSVQWSYKSEAQEYTVGVYMYSLFSAYNQAYSVISEAQGDSFDSTKSILDIESSFDETGEVFNTREWILKEADYITKNLLAMDKVMADYGITIDEASYNSALEQAKSDWYLGAYYEEYLAYGYSATPYSEILEPYGISFENFFDSTYHASLKQNAIFDHLYSKGGEKAVPDSEMKAYFEDNYTSYSYFTVNLYETATDETTGETVSVALDEEKTDELKENLKLYKNMIKSGTSFEDIIGVYAAYAELEYDPSISNIENLENTSLGEEVADTIANMKDGTAEVVYVGQENSTVAYFVYKKSISSETKEYIKSETNYNTLLSSMKGDEFLDYLDELTETVECEINSNVLEKYNPEIFEADL